MRVRGVDWPAEPFRLLFFPFSYTYSVGHLTDGTRSRLSGPISRFPDLARPPADVVYGYVYRFAVNVHDRPSPTRGYRPGPPTLSTRENVRMYMRPFAMAGVACVPSGSLHRPSSLKVREASITTISP